MMVSMRKSALAKARLGGTLSSLWDVARWDGAGESRARSGHNCRKDSKSFRPWQRQSWGRKALAEMFPAPVPARPVSVPEWTELDRLMNTDPTMVLMSLETCECRSCRYTRQEEERAEWTARMEGLYPEAFNTYLQIPEEFFSYPEAFSGDSHGGNGIGWDWRSAEDYEWSAHWGYLDLPEEDRADEACYRLEYQYEDHLVLEETPEFIRVKHGWAEM